MIFMKRTSPRLAQCAKTFLVDPPNDSIIRGPPHGSRIER